MPEAIRLHPPCTQEGLTEGPRISRGFELNGVPGQVRTANLPLRRGMLYPIELLRHRSTTKKRGAMDGVHVNGQACFCHVVRWAF
jgi:hypothetical protein